MKKIITAVSIFILALATFAQAETVKIFGDEDSKVIFRTTDDGEVRSSIANRIGDNSWFVVEDGHGTIVNDFSSGRDRDSDD